MNPYFATFEFSEDVKPSFNKNERPNESLLSSYDPRKLKAMSNQGEETTLETSESEPVYYEVQYKKSKGGV
jgi:hypothetical protein